MIVGVSRVKQFQGCPRQWWIGEVQEVKLPHSYGQVFGNVLHACLERWLKEEEPHPPGWQWCPESRQRVDPKDETLIQQTLLPQAVEKGYLRRHPERFVERTWWKFLGESGNEHNQCLIAKGTIDLAEPGVIVDHKGSKNVKNWSKTKAELREDLQLLVYAHVNEKIRGIPHLPTDTVTVGHLNYCRTTGEVSEKIVSVSWQRCMEAWAEFHKTATRMLPLAKVRHVDQIPCALDEPPDDNGERTCDKYGGCGYLPICSASPKKIRGEFEQFKVRILRASLPPQARLDFQRSIDDMVNNKSTGKRVKPSPFEDEEDEAPPPPKKSKKAPAPEPEDEPEDEDEDEEDEAPPPPKKSKKAPAPEPEEEDEDEEDEAPPPPKKSKKAPAPEPEEEDEDEAPEPNFTDRINTMKSPELREHLLNVYHVLIGVLKPEESGL